MLLKFANKHKAILLKVLNLFPSKIQSYVKIFYRKYSNNKLYKEINFSLSSRKYEYQDGHYNVPENLNKELKAGVNLVGFPTGQFGLATHLRSVGGAIDIAGIDYSYYDCSNFDLGNFQDNSVTDKIEKVLNYNTNIFVCNGDLIAQLYSEQRQNFFDEKYNIHYGAWELRNYPEEWIPTLNLFDEYWAMSSFLQKSVSDSAVIPVVHMPYPVDFETPTQYTRKHFGLPENKFLYIFTFDMSSVMERKNPKAVIKSFYAAFPKNDDVGLVIKVIRKKAFINQKKELENLMLDLLSDKRIFLIDEVLPQDQILGLINVCDVYVSLHRAEGLGIGMAEAMKMNKVVIATNYSGNTDFTLADNSCLVDYKLIPIKPLDYIYEKGKVWADADIDHAAFYMKKLFEDKNYYNSLAKKGKEFIDQNYSTQVIKEKYLLRFRTLGLVK